MSFETYQLDGHVGACASNLLLSSSALLTQGSTMPATASAKSPAQMLFHPTLSKFLSEGEVV